MPSVYRNAGMTERQGSESSNQESRCWFFSQCPPNKLRAKWRGPYRIVRREGKVNYLVDLHDTRKRKRVLHVNLLKQWHTPVATSFFAEETEEDIDVPEWRATDTKQPTMGEQLTPAERTALGAMLAEFQDVLQSCPGRTFLAAHQIRSGEAPPVRLPPYSLPHAYKEAIEEELQEMLDTGIIEPAQSEWAAPIVIVRKKEGGIRLCVNYCRLKSVTAVDPYPMPHIDDLIDRLGSARYISTLDLTRGY